MWFVDVSGRELFRVEYIIGSYHQLHYGHGDHDEVVQVMRAMQAASKTFRATMKETD